MGRGGKREGKEGKGKVVVEKWRSQREKGKRGTSEGERKGRKKGRKEGRKEGRKAKGRKVEGERRM